MNRGERLSYGIKVSGMNRRKFANISGISEHTLRSWESSGNDKVTEKNVDRIIHAFLKTKVITDKNWILHGSGQPPTLMNHITQDSSNFHTIEAYDSTVEVERFRALGDRIVLFLEEDFYPFFSKGSYVGGDVSSLNQNLNGKLCIITSYNKITFIGFVFVKNEDLQTVNIYKLKSNMSLECVADNLKIYKIARINYHRI